MRHCFRGFHSGTPTITTAILAAVVKVQNNCIESINRRRIAPAVVGELVMPEGNGSGSAEALNRRRVRPDLVTDLLVRWVATPCAFARLANQEGLGGVVPPKVASCGAHSGHGTVKDAAASRDLLIKTKCAMHQLCAVHHDCAGPRAQSWSTRNRIRSKVNRGSTTDRARG